MILVVDASVALKWFFRERPEEPDREPAVEILEGIDNNIVQMIQPPHFFAEVAAVLAREQPSSVAEQLEDLWQIRWEVAESASVYALAAELSMRFRHHLFDTLYHAAALSSRDATLITADDKYYEKARDQGRIARLADFALSRS